MKPTAILFIAFASSLAAMPSAFAEGNKIAPMIDSVQVMHNGKPVTVQRGHDPQAHLPDAYQKTERGCPPFCVQPMTAVPGVDTIGELEMLEYLQRSSQGEESILVIDSRTPDWVMRGTIPGSVNIPWTLLKEDTSDPITIAGILEERFGAIDEDELWNFSEVKTLVLFCNGMWCGQSPRNIETLLKYGYPANSIKWYRGGMQNWQALGLTTVK